MSNLIAGSSYKDVKVALSWWDPLLLHTPSNEIPV